MDLVSLVHFVCNLVSVWKPGIEGHNCFQQVDQIYQKFECGKQSSQGIVRNVVRWSIPRLLEVSLSVFFFLLLLLGCAFYGFTDSNPNNHQMFHGSRWKIKAF